MMNYVLRISIIMLDIFALLTANNIFQVKFLFLLPFITILSILTAKEKSKKTIPILTILTIFPSYCTLVLHETGGVTILVVGSSIISILLILAAIVFDIAPLLKKMNQHLMSNSNDDDSV